MATLYPESLDREIEAEYTIAYETEGNSDFVNPLKDVTITGWFYTDDLKRVEQTVIDSITQEEYSAVIDAILYQES